MNSPQPEDPLLPVEELEISAHEREQVLSQIERVIAEGRGPETADLVSLSAQKKGLLFPLLINLAALLLIACGVFLLSRYFQLQKESITLGGSSYLSTEGALIETLIEESESKLKAKEAEISDILKQLEEVDRERVALKANLEADLASKERDLRSRMQEELEAEKKRLTALGTSTAGIADRLRTLERRQENTLSREIEQYRRERSAELEQRELELRRLQLNAEEALEKANRERELLLVALQARFEQEKEALESRTTSAEQRLRDLSARVQEGNLLEDQIQAFYLSVKENLESGSNSAALQDLAELESFYREDSSSVLPVLAERREVDLFLIASLKDFVHARMSRSGAGNLDAAPAEGAGHVSAAELAELRERLSQKDREIASFQSELRAASQATAAEGSRTSTLVSQLQEQNSSLSSRQRESESRIAQLSSQVRESEAKVSRLSAQVQSLQAERDALSRSAQSAAGAAFGKGRDAALRDVMGFLGYLSGSVEDRQAFEAGLLAQARRDPLYRAVTREIQILMAGGSAAGGLTAPFMFLGIVSSISAGKVVVEAMVDLKPSVGTFIQIRRISELEKELSIAEGKILQVQGSKITASFQPTGSSGLGPAARDMVYIEVSSSGG